ncbi:MAG: DNA mismatch repair endonuclease MutL [Lachnospiraceae bacterium]|nr:DNA mismatch repair endonuclease MutL [Lachnospiraceae bacterium]
MPQIQVLDQETINKIAAGEVIDRPQSVVKELLENAIDAGATAVTVEIKDGGISLIRITDNGCGFDKEQIPLAFLRHSTSKIKSIEDLATVSSLGFRGEALSSIAAVAQVELITKPAFVLNGSRYQIEGGKEKSFEEIGAPEGTTFLVRNLFYNTPVRRKFLKTPVTEAGYISDVVEKLALSHPEVSVRFINNGQTKLHTNGNGNLKDAIYSVYGREITSALMPIEFSSKDVSVTGFIGKPVIARGNRAYENYFINGRYIKSNLISKAIEDGYHGHLMQHKYPFTILQIKIDPLLLDVNVHPSKMELRFRNAEEIYQLIMQAVRDAFTHKEMIPRVPVPEAKVTEVKVPVSATVNNDASPTTSNITSNNTQTKYEPVKPQPKSERAPEPFEKTRIEHTKPIQQPMVQNNVVEKHDDVAAVTVSPTKSQPVITPQMSVVMEDSGYTVTPKESVKPKEQKPEQLTLFDDKLLTKEAKAKHKIIGQLFDTYWLIEYNDSLFIIDQHAAHEKVLYERTVKAIETREYTSQQISPPLIVSLSMREEEYLNKNLAFFKKIGFEIEHFGGKEYALYALPENLFGLANKYLFLDMLDSLVDNIKTTDNEMILSKIASMSCKAAVKGNHRLSMPEIEALIDELLKLENPYNCPHGRPTIISMSKYELEKKFKRIV